MSFNYGMITLNLQKILRININNAFLSLSVIKRMYMFIIRVICFMNLIFVLSVVG